MNEILAAKGSVAFAGDDIVGVRISTRRSSTRILAENHLKAVTAKEAGKPVKPLRIGLYRPWHGEHGRRLDALDSGAVQVPVHEPV